MKIIENVSATDVVKKILEQKIVALYQGRSEAGERALGNRSLLFDPRNKNGKDIVNVVKRRESFRPFAATILYEYANDYFHMEHFGESPFMSYSIRCREEKIKDMPAVVHIDNTCRVQTLKRAQNPNYYNLISKFFVMTGVPLLLNTSFNLAGDPIVETPEDAIETLMRSTIPYLYLPEIDMLVENPNGK
jgi:carbamoyltransferase|tara:strand:+ start:763 stop:1332 length:570 start_codon:yes stop_codon:yes gene_type:complete